MMHTDKVIRLKEYIKNKLESMNDKEIQHLGRKMGIIRDFEKAIQRETKMRMWKPKTTDTDNNRKPTNNIL